MAEFYLLVVGSRTFDNYTEAEQVMNSILSPYRDNGQRIFIISGGAKGADAIAENYAKAHGLYSIVMKADWNKYGKAAGYYRNRAMHEFIVQHSERLCLAFWDGVSKGTQHSFKLAEEYGNPIRIYNTTMHCFVK